MAIRLFNTYSRSIEPFTPLDPEARTVRMYTCGPTVYDYAHIGNFRAYTWEDLLQRHLEARGYHVLRVMNLTDVDDKTIRGCRREGMSLESYTERYKAAFFADIDILRIKRAAHYPAATDPVYVERMRWMIDELARKEIAYQADDGSVYFRLARFPDYGKLAHLNLEDLRPTGRIKNDEYEKESIGDFALWKAWDEQDGDVAWDSRWGRGRPGWHIECSAMCTALLGDQIDIHCGAVDNIFPHHEAEIAQSESVTGKRFVRYWLHCAHLMVDGQKMSKKLGNFYTLRDLLEKGWTGREIRYALLSVNYRLPLNFTLEGLAAARAAVARIDAFVDRLKERAADSVPAACPAFAAERVEAFFSQLDDDLNISAALAELFELIRAVNAQCDADSLSPQEAAAILAAWHRVDSVLCIARPELAVPPEVTALLNARSTARAAKEWAQSDRLRDEIAALGWLLKDTKEGQKVTPMTT